MDSTTAGPQLGAETAEASAQPRADLHSPPAGALPVSGPEPRPAQQLDAVAAFRARSERTAPTELEPHHSADLAGGGEDDDAQPVMRARPRGRPSKRTPPAAPRAARARQEEPQRAAPQRDRSHRTLAEKLSAAASVDDVLSCLDFSGERGLLSADLAAALRARLAHAGTPPAEPTAQQNAQTAPAPPAEPVKPATFRGVPVKRLAPYEPQAKAVAKLLVNLTRGSALDMNDGDEVTFYEGTPAEKKVSGAPVGQLASLIAAVMAEHLPAADDETGEPSATGELLGWALPMAKVAVSTYGVALVSHVTTVVRGAARLLRRAR